MQLAQLRASDDPAAPDPEISYLAALDDRLSADPYTYFRWIERLGEGRLRSDESADVLSAAVVTLGQRLSDKTIAAFACGEALQVCLADLILLEELDETDVPSSAVAALRRRLVPASVDLVGRIMRNLTLRRDRLRAQPVPASRGPAGRLSERSDWSRIERARLDRQEPVIVIATAGRGTRLRSTIPKGLVPVGGVPMIEHAIRAASRAGVRQQVFVVKYGADVQQHYLARHGHVVVQATAEGSGHSVYAGLTALNGWQAPILIAYSDCPFLGVGSFCRLTQEPMNRGEAFRLSVYAPAREGAGRVVRGQDGEIERIDQPRVADVFQDEADGGLYALSCDSFYRALGGITNQNARGEYQLTDVITRLRATNLRVSAVSGPSEDFQSVDSPADLVMAKLRVATSAQTPAQLAEPQVAPEILRFLSSYGLGLPADVAPRAGMPARLQNYVGAAVTSVRALVGPLLDLSGGA